MIIIHQLKLKPGYTQDELFKKAAAILKIPAEDIKFLQLERRSIDARKKPDIFYSLSVSVKVDHEESVLRRLQSNPDVSIFKPVKYDFKPTGEIALEHRPVVVGAGPCGLFCALYLARAGYKPILLDRGYDVDSRTKDVEDFWATGKLKPNSNVLFGEGGAGAFSDGKINSLVKDKSGRNNEVLKTFVEFGADPSIIYDAKPHIGTDVLCEIIKNIREEIKRLGGEVRYNALVTDIEFNNAKVKNVEINGFAKEECEVCVLAIGHSARDTFELLYNKGFKLEQKDFAVGFRVEHKQSMIDNSMYSEEVAAKKILPPATYKLTHKASNGRGVYSFCMCPGGFVVNASSEPERLCINGMSYSKRNGNNANSAIIVTVTSEDFGSKHPLAGISFQREIEEKAYKLGNGLIPVEFYIDFKRETEGKEKDFAEPDMINLFSYSPETKGAYSFSQVSSILPKELNEAFIEGMEAFDRQIPGFANDFTLVSGIEARTSSPVRITRYEDTFECEGIEGIYPGGEGAGYAGGILSAAIDGIKIFEKIASKYKPIKE